MVGSAYLPAPLPNSKSRFNRPSRDFVRTTPRLSSRNRVDKPVPTGHQRCLNTRAINRGTRLLSLGVAARAIPSGRSVSATYSGRYASSTRSMDSEPATAMPRIRVMRRPEPRGPRPQRLTPRSPYAAVCAWALAASLPYCPPAVALPARLLHSLCFLHLRGNDCSVAGRTLNSL